MKLIKILGMIAIIFSFLMVGSPLSFNCLPLSMAIIAFGTILVFYKIYKRKPIYTCKKIDLVVLIFFIAPVIPLFLNKYYSLVDTLNLLLKNISFFNIYFFVRELLGEDKKNIKFLYAAILVGGYVLALLGIAGMFGSKIFTPYVRLFKIVLPHTNSNRMPSIVGYENAFAIIMAVDLLICINNWKNHKALYSVLFLLYFGCFALAFSRISIILLMGLLFLYIVFVKKVIKFRYILFVVLLACLVLEIGLTFDRPLKMFNQGDVIDFYKRIITVNAKANTDYTFELDIDAKSENNVYEDYCIFIRERDLAGDIIINHILDVDNMNGRRVMKIITTEDTQILDIGFICNDSELQRGLTINGLYVNGEKIPLSYTLLPDGMVEQLKNINWKNASVIGRLNFIRDGINIIKDHYLFGIGGNGWRHIYNDYQEENYGALEAHSFIIDTFINTGLVGFITLIIILLYAFINILRKKEKISIVDIAFILLTLHSFVDFDMSFYCVAVLWTTLLAMNISNKDKEQKKTNGKDKKTYVLCAGVILLNFMGLITGVVDKNVRLNNYIRMSEISSNINDKEYSNAIDIMKQHHKTEKSEKFTEYLIVMNYADLDNEQLEFVYDFIKNRKLTVITSFNIERNNIIKRVLTTSTNDEWKQKFAEIVIEENDKMKANISDRTRNKLRPKNITGFLEEQESLYQMALGIRGNAVDE